MLAVLVLGLFSAGSFLAHLLGLCSAVPAILSAATLLLGGGLYSATVLGASVMTARVNGWALLPVLAPVFVCYHVGYGWGFLRGAWDFAIRKKKTASQFVELTRVG